MPAIWGAHLHFCAGSGQVATSTWPYEVTNHQGRGYMRAHAAAVLALLLAQVTPTVCVPDGLPPFRSWVTIDTSVDFVNDEAGVPILVALRRHRLPGGHVVTTWWHEDALLMVRDQPDQPPLIDIGVMTRSQLLISSTARAVCEFVRAKERRP